LKWAEGSGLDSVELVMAIKEEFGLEIPDTNAEKLITLVKSSNISKAVWP